MWWPTRISLCRCASSSIGLAKSFLQFQKQISRPPPQFETYEKEGKLYSRVRVGTLAVFDQNSPGSASLAESQGQAAYTWLTTFPNTWLEPAKSKVWPAPDHAAAPDHARPFNLVGQLNSAEKKQGIGFGGSKGDSQNGSTSGLKLKPLNMLVQKEVKIMQPCVAEVAGQMVPGPETSKVGESPSSWAVVKLADFLKSNHTRKSFWGSSFVLLVVSAVEMRTLSLKKAANMLGVDVQELERQVSRLKNEEKKFSQGGSLSKNALSKIKSEACVEELGDWADSLGATRTGHLQNSDQVDGNEKRGVKRKANSSAAWITGEVVVHLLRRSFSMKDQFFPFHSGTPPVFVLRMSWPFYESNVKRVVEEIDEYCGFTELLMNSREVQELLKAARNLDNQKMEGGGYSLAPIYNYSRCMLEENANYWETGLPALLLQDVDIGLVLAEVAACQLGVTPTMLHSAIAWLKSQDKFSSLWEIHSQQKVYESEEDSGGDDDGDDDDNWSAWVKELKQKKKESKQRTTRTSVKKQKLSGPVTVQRYKECGFGSEEDFWNENTTKDVLEKVC